MAILERRAQPFRTKREKYKRGREGKRARKQDESKMWRCENVKMTWEDVRRCVRRCEDVRMWRWEDEMWRCEDVRMWGCEDERMRCEDVKMRRCEDDMRRCEDVRMWRCEDVKMRGWDVKMWRCDEKMWWQTDRPPLLEEPFAQTLSGKTEVKITIWSALSSFVVRSSTGTYFVQVL